MNRKDTRWPFLVLCITIACGGLSHAQQEEKKPRPNFTVGKETTYVDGPLTKDGYIDYAAALNKRLSVGVTPENNANVLLWKAFGPHPNGETMPPEFFKWLGYEPPERGEYFTDLHGYLRTHLKVDPEKQPMSIDEIFDRVSERPWIARQYPEVADYLKANAKPLALVVEATRRSHYFSPLVPTGDAGLLSALVPGVQKCRQLAHALTARAMLHLGEGRDDEAWQDLLACHRLGRLVGRSATAIESLVGIAIDTIANHADLVYLERSKLNAKQLAERLRDLQRLPPMPTMADRVDLGERFVFLDCVLSVASGRDAVLGGIAAGQRKALTPKDKEALASIHWDLALRNANRWYDRAAAAMRLQDRAAREAALKELVQDADIRGVHASKLRKQMIADALLGKAPTPQALGESIGDVLIGLLMPAVTKLQHASDRTTQRAANLHVAFALAAYQRDHKRYPMKLEALAPAYLPQLPQDIFSGKALVYRLTPNGYLMYSVGVNGQDDQGRSADDEPPGDDLTVRMPLPEPRKR
ncbi:MAG TPA: hypothetical protein VEL76_28320 [Gemmataceae bacterium]|nr:hypothetical protein [Gemmataceae bacterium]